MPASCLLAIVLTMDETSASTPVGVTDRPQALPEPLFLEPLTAAGCGERERSLHDACTPGLQGITTHAPRR
jgi:hypothetical protein